MALINDFLSLIYPRHCEACGICMFRHEQYLCTHCTLNLPKNNYHRDYDNGIVRTLAGRVPLMYGMCLYLFEKSGKVQKLLHAIKYQDQKELAAHLGRLYASNLTASDWGNDIDVIVPIPLHKNKLKARGYNQSEWYAKGLAEGLGKRLDPFSMTRMIDTTTQTRKKKFQRWENVDGIFEIKDPAPLIHKHILVVDDVITTGATIEAAWQVLKTLPGIRMSVASIGFAARSYS